MMRRLRLAALLSTLVLAACGKGESVKRVVFPPEPEPARFVFEGRLSGVRDLATDSVLRKAAGTENQPAFAKPLNIAARFGRIYITDSQVRVVHVFDVARRTFFRLGIRLEGKLSRPIGVATDANGLLYVADADDARVVMFDEFGAFRREFGRGAVTRPVAVAPTRDGSRVYVIDNPGTRRDTHRVVIFSGDGTRLGEFGGFGAAPGRFNRPSAAAVGKDGRLYVLDSGNFRVQVFDPDGKFLKSWGEVGRLPGQFARPRDLSIDDTGNVYVTDALFGNLQIFDPDGALLLPLGQPGTGDEPGEFRLIAGVAVDETGRIYVVDQARRNVSIFAPVSPKPLRRPRLRRRDQAHPGIFSCHTAARIPVERLRADAPPSSHRLGARSARHSLL